MTCTVNNKQICGSGTSKKCGCDGDGCSFVVPVNAACEADSTPRYFGSLPNWKTCDEPIEQGLWPQCTNGVVERSEYPPKPALGWNCGATTVWAAAPGVSLQAEADGYGARLKFPSKGSFKIKACRKGSDSLCTEKTAKVQ